MRLEIYVAMIVILNFSEGVGLLYLPENSDQKQAFVNVVMTLQVT
jgi:uncharacterized membrane protein